MKLYRATHTTLKNGRKLSWFGSQAEAQEWTQSAANETSGGCGSSVETCEFEMRKPAILEFLNKLEPSTWKD